MKFACGVLITTFSAAIHASPVYRCEYGQGNVAYQDTPCPTPRTSVATTDFFTAPDATGPWDSGRPDPRRLLAQQEGRAIAIRVRARQAVSDGRNAPQYAENRSRCAMALRVADECGKYAGTFYCDEKGFQPTPKADRAERPVLDNAGRYKMERCAQDSARRNR